MTTNSDHNNHNENGQDRTDPGEGSPLDALTPDDLERVYDDESVLYWEVENPREWIYARNPARTTR